MINAALPWLLHRLGKEREVLYGNMSMSLDCMVDIALRSSILIIIIDCSKIEIGASYFGKRGSFLRPDPI